MDARHEIFVQQMLMHGDRQRAYLAAYPLTEVIDLAGEAEAMENSPGISWELNQRRRRREENLAKRSAKKPLLTLERKREILAAMAEGEWQAKRHIKIKDLIVEVYDDINAYQAQRAMELDSKLAADYYKEKQYETSETEEAGNEETAAELPQDADEVLDIIEEQLPSKKKNIEQKKKTANEKHNDTVVSCKGGANAYNASQPDDGARPWKQPSMLQRVLQKIKEGEKIAHSKAYEAL